MPRSKSAEKTERSAGKRRLRNRSVSSATKTYVTKAEKLIASNEPESSQAAVMTATRVIDKAAQKGVIHRNTAARRKSRLVKKLNRALSSNTTSGE